MRASTAVLSVLLDESPALRPELGDRAGIAAARGTLGLLTTPHAARPGLWCYVRKTWPANGTWRIATTLGNLRPARRALPRVRLLARPWAAVRDPRRPARITGVAGNAWALDDVEGYWVCAPSLSGVSPTLSTTSS
jgi:hypothetical protein